MQADIMGQMQRVGLSDHAAHTRLVQALQMSGAITRYITRHVQDGIAVEQELNLRGNRID